jgi:hypothetical protein
MASPGYFPPTQAQTLSSATATTATSPSYPAGPAYQAPGVSQSTLTTIPIPPSPPYASLLSTLTRARVGLIQELVEVFNIVEVGGRPTIGGRKGARGEWTIGSGLVLPVPGDIRRAYFFLLSPLVLYITLSVLALCISTIVLTDDRIE